MSLEYIQGLFTEHRHGSMLFDRMARLEAAGFRVVHRGRRNVIDFVHPSRHVKPVALMADGRVTDHPDEQILKPGRLVIPPEDKEGFDRWLEGIPRPTRWQRLSKPWR